MRIASALLALTLLPTATMADSSKIKSIPYDFAPPAISLADAVEKAGICLSDKKIETQDAYLSSARFERIPTPDRLKPEHGRYWIVTLRKPGVVKGGEIFIDVYEDLTCVVTFGE